MNLGQKALISDGHIFASLLTGLFGPVQTNPKSCEAFSFKFGSSHVACHFFEGVTMTTLIQEFAA